METVASPAATPAASGKQVVLDLLGRLPEDASLEDILEKIRLAAAVREAEEEIARGETAPWEEVKQRISAWTTKS